jgi:putative hydrolases of HD superfamily
MAVEIKTDDPRIRQQMNFLLEIDKLKLIQRKNWVGDGSRHENTAEHSWHIAVMALVLAEYAEEPVNISRVVELLLVHDLVEIHAGDTFLYDAQANLGKLEREQAAAQQIFSLLPEPQAAEFRVRWDEFEGKTTAEARFAAAIDAFQPMLQNWAVQGGSWRQNGVTGAKALERKRQDLEAFPRLWDYAQRIVRGAVAAGYIEP